MDRTCSETVPPSNEVVCCQARRLCLAQGSTTCGLGRLAAVVNTPVGLRAETYPPLGAELET